MSELKNKVKTLVGGVGLFGRAEAIVMVARAVNANAIVLKELIDKVDRIESEGK